jgi:acetyl esterase/lipase
MSAVEHADGVVIRRGVVVSRPKGYRPLEVDVYVPVAGSRALCVYLHGGSWLTGSRRDGPGPSSSSSDRLFARAARLGLAVVSVDYRLAGEARFPAQLHDLGAALEYVRDHQAELGIGDVPLVLWGSGSGGLLAALQTLTSAEPVAGCALWSAATDLRTLPHAGDSTGFAARLLGGTPDQAPLLAAKASPAAHVHVGAPPFMLLHGDEDDTVPSSQSSSLHRALSALGVRSTYESVHGYDHAFTGMPDGVADGLVDRTVLFLLGCVDDAVA